LFREIASTYHKHLKNDNKYIKQEMTLSVAQFSPVHC